MSETGGVSLAEQNNITDEITSNPDNGNELLEEKDMAAKVAEVIRVDIFRSGEREKIEELLAWINQKQYKDEFGMRLMYEAWYEISEGHSIRFRLIPSKQIIQIDGVFTREFIVSASTGDVIYDETELKALISVSEKLTEVLGVKVVPGHTSLQNKLQT